MQFLPTSPKQLIVILSLLTGMIPVIGSAQFERPRLVNYGKEVTLNETIVVQKGEVFDGELSNGKWTLYRANKNRLGDGSQKENQKPLFILEPGARIQNVIIDNPAADGIHVRTDDGYITTVRKVQFRGIGEDAITVENGDTDAYVLIDECVFLDAADKVIQINSTARVLIERCYAEDFQFFARTNGSDKKSHFGVDIDGLVARNGGTIVKTSSSNAIVKVSNCVTDNIRNVVEAPGGVYANIWNIRTVSGERIRRPDDQVYEEDGATREGHLLLRILNGLSNLE